MEQSPAAEQRSEQHRAAQWGAAQQSSVEELGGAAEQSSGVWSSGMERGAAEWSGSAE